jgi:tight adherence protein B
MHSVDLMWAVMAIRIQREVGGNLAELLDTVARTMTQREQLKHEMLALTAEGRLSAWILGVFPPGFALVLFAIQPDYMKVLFDNGIGVVAVIIAAVMAGLGFFWLRRMMAIEV